jgi:hypothetical protein
MKIAKVTEIHGCHDFPEHDSLPPSSRGRLVPDPSALAGSGRALLVPGACGGSAGYPMHGKANANRDRNAIFAAIECRKQTVHHKTGPALTSSQLNF